MRCSARTRVAAPPSFVAHRARIGTRRGRRVLGCFTQAVLLLRFMRQRATVADLARDNAVSLTPAAGPLGS